MISPWTVYFILMLDNIKIAFIVFFSICMIFFVVQASEDLDALKESKQVSNCGAILFFVCIISAILLIFLPSTKQAAAIYIIPKLSKSTTIKNLPEDFQLIVNNLLINQEKDK